MESMTGFSSVSGKQGICWTWVLRSVNGKSLDIRCRMPPGFDVLEQNAREILRETFTRGNISVSLETKADEQNSSLKLNEPLLDELCRTALAWQVRYPELRPARLDGLMGIPGVLKAVAENEEQAAQRQKALLESFRDAVHSLEEARMSEGEKIAVFLNRHVDKIEELCRKARGLASVQPQKVKECLLSQLESLKEDTSIPEERFLQEVSMCMLRVDVREELDRLTAHVKTARELFTEKGSIGKKLDFLCQELNREANTLASKSSDIELTRVAMALKTAIDQLREQVQNIE